MKPTTKEEAANWQWLQKAIEDPVYSGRKILTGIHFTKERQVSADGKRIHIVKDRWYGEDGIFFLNDGKKLNKTPKDYKATKLSGEYPQIERVMPTEEPTQIITLNRQQLEDAISMPCDYVRIEFRGEKKPIVIRDFVLNERETGKNYVAVIMPLHLGRR
jgi:DNA polymerase III sliding clamp (beta) subunit (PCNA family)